MAQYGQELHLDMHSKNAHPIMRMTAGGVYIVDVHITENGIDAFDDYVSRITTGLNGNTYLAIRWAENSAARWWLSDAGIDSENKCLSFAVKAPDKVSGRAVGYLAIDYMRSQLFFVDVESANLSYDTPAETNVKYQELTKAQYDALATKDPDTLYKVNHAGNYTYYIGNSILASEYGLITKNITQNGIYNATDDSADGYSSVLVNVSSGADYVQDGLIFQTCMDMSESSDYCHLSGTSLFGDSSSSRNNTLEIRFKGDVKSGNTIGVLVWLYDSGSSKMGIRINSGQIEVSPPGYIFDTGISYTPNTWITISIVGSSSTGLSLYINGSRTAWEKSSSSYAWQTQVNEIYFRGLDSTRIFEGEMPSVRVYNRALTDEEIAQNYAVDQSRYV